MVIESLNRGDLNHATASYNLLVLPWVNFQSEVFDCVC
jgi:hypothetical protein